MARTKLGVLAIEGDDESYFGSIRAAAGAFAVPHKDMRRYIDEGQLPRGYVQLLWVRKRRIADKTYLKNIQVTVPHNYFIGIEAIAAAQGLSVTQLVRNCILNNFTEEEIWAEAEKQIDFAPTKFVSMRPRVLPPLPPSQRIRRKKKRK